ncbi:pectate lyase [Hymenobacter humi]|uniref:Pectate lyase n=1 Tax=Hymenobacter humi TaxID=1411620 RepID=A0ABW2U0Z2_9BACT
MEIVRFLMGIEKPSAAVKTAIECAVDWFEKVKISGYAVKEITAPQSKKVLDRVIVPEPGSTIWARFYELNTDRPIYVGRDSKVHYQLLEIEVERRAGYLYAGTWPAKLLATDYPAWQKRVNTAPGEAKNKRLSAFPMTTLTKALAVAAPAATTAVAWPTPALFDLPEKVLQFGTGVLLRGLPDFMIDEANRQGVFNGRIVVVKSTDGGDATAFDRQNGLYTVCVRGIDDGKPVEENVVCASISRVLSAKSQWAEVLEFATSPDLQVVISNTTEVGIQLVNEDIHLTPPQSFPGKLLAVLYARFQAFEGDASRGLVVVPTELIPDNGRKLEAIVLELAHRNDLGSEFIDWLESANHFCNTLVDRIVPGRPDPATYEQLQADLGYQDEPADHDRGVCPLGH